MSGVVYCGSMGDWPLLSSDQRHRGVERLIEAGVPVVVGTGAPSPSEAASHASHAESVGAVGLMVIPRVLSRGSSAAAQRAHFAGVLGAASSLPSVIYNSPYYGFETRAELFFDLRREFPNLVGYKEFGGRASLSYAAEHITSASDDLALVVGVDTEVVHGIVNCGAKGVITGIGNVLPDVVLRLIELSRAAVDGDPDSMRLGARAGACARTAGGLRRGSRPGALLQVPRCPGGRHRLRTPDRLHRLPDRQPAPLRGGAVRPFPPLVGELGGQPLVRFVNVPRHQRHDSGPEVRLAQIRPRWRSRAILLNRWPSGDDSQR